MGLRELYDDGEGYAAGDEHVVRIPNGYVIQWWELLGTFPNLSRDDRRTIFRAGVALAFSRLADDERPFDSRAAGQNGRS